jgi:hypothetical protein
MDWNGMEHAMYNDDVVSKLGKNINATKNNHESLLGAGEEVGVEVNAEMTMYMVMPCHQNKEQSHN